MPVINVIYNDKSDERDMPFKPFHLTAVERIVAHLGLTNNDSGEVLPLDWYYHASIHGATFWFNPKTLGDRARCSRFDRETMKFFADFPNLRWIEHDGDRIQIGLTHYIDETVK